MSFEETTAAEHRRMEIEDAVCVLRDDCRFSEMWQVREYARFILEGYEKADALRQVFGIGQNIITKQPRSNERELRRLLTASREMLVYYTRGVSSPSADAIKNRLLPEIDTALDC